MIPADNSFDREGLPFAMRDKVIVVAVDEASPPNSPINKMPRCDPASLTATYPTKDRPEISMTVHPTW